MNIIEKLKELNFTISTAESLTAGLVGAKLCDIAGASSVFKGGITAYTKEMKCELLHLDMQEINKYGVYSFETVISMAKGISEQTGSDVAIATSGVAGPDSDEGVEAGTVYFCFKIKEAFYTECTIFKGSRNEVREQASNYALERMKQYL